MQKTKDVFSSYHPIINFVFYLGAFFFGMMFFHPVYLACSVVLSGAYYMTIRGSAGLKYMLGMIPLFVLMSLVNPIFNTRGDTVLFTCFSGRAYTLQAVFYGMALSSILITVIGWFASYNAVMTSDKFLYLFGRTVPSLSLVLTMVLRFVPNYQKRITQIRAARNGIGKSGADGSNREKAENSMTILSALTSWALEGGIVTADSMRSRGFGCGKRTCFSIYRMEMRDWILLAIMILVMAVTGFCSVMGGATVSYLPDVDMTMNGYTIAGVISYSLFLVIPTATNILEDITWRILRSGI